MQVDKYVGKTFRVSRTTDHFFDGLEFICTKAYLISKPPLLDGEVTKASENQRRSGYAPGTSVRFYLDNCDVVESRQTQELGDLIVILQEQRNIEYFKTTYGESLKFKREYLNGRNLEYIFGMLDLDLLETLFEDTAIKQLTWCPNASH